MDQVATPPRAQSKLADNDGELATLSVPVNGLLTPHSPDKFVFTDAFFQSALTGESDLPMVRESFVASLEPVLPSPGIVDVQSSPAGAISEANHSGRKRNKGKSRNKGKAGTSLQFEATGTHGEACRPEHGHREHPILTTPQQPDQKQNKTLVTPPPIPSPLMAAAAGAPIPLPDHKGGAGPPFSVVNQSNSKPKSKTKNKAARTIQTPPPAPTPVRNAQGKQKKSIQTPPPAPTPLRNAQGKQKKSKAKPPNVDTSHAPLQKPPPMPSPLAATREAITWQQQALMAAPVNSEPARAPPKQQKQHKPQKQNEQPQHEPEELSPSHYTRRRRTLPTPPAAPGVIVLSKEQHQQLTEGGEAAVAKSKSNSGSKTKKNLKQNRTTAGDDGGAAGKKPHQGGVVQTWQQEQLMAADVHKQRAPKLDGGAAGKKSYRDGGGQTWQQEQLMAGGGETTGNVGSRVKSKAKQQHSVIAIDRPSKTDGTRIKGGKKKGKKVNVAEKFNNKSRFAGLNHEASPDAAMLPIPAGFAA